MKQAKDWKQIDSAFLAGLKDQYSRAIRGLAAPSATESPPAGQQEGWSSFNACNNCAIK